MFYIKLIKCNISIVALEKPLFIREKMNRTYSLSAYYWGKTSSEFPFHILFATLVITIVYFVIGLNDTSISKFFILGFLFFKIYFKFPNNFNSFNL